MHTIRIKTNDQPYMYLTKYLHTEKSYIHVCPISTMSMYLLHILVSTTIIANTDSYQSGER